MTNVNGSILVALNTFIVCISSLYSGV